MQNNRYYVCLLSLYFLILIQSSTEFLCNYFFIGYLFSSSSNNNICLHHSLHYNVLSHNIIFDHKPSLHIFFKIKFFYFNYQY